MNEKINLIELLKDCPKGMPLDCAIFNGTVTFSRIVNNEQYPIEIKIDDDYKEYLNKYGSYVDRSFAQCVIFPKDKTTWEGFQRPFIDGDVITSSGGCVAIFSNLEEDDSVLFHCVYGQGVKLIAKKGSGIGRSNNCRFATEHEKEILFTALKDNGYKWNPETKTLEKLIVPKFKVGDKIRHKTTNIDYILEISRVYNDSYGLVGCVWMLSMEYQNEYELVPNKFDPKTLQPFDKVLVTDSLHNVWYAGFFSHINESKDYPFAVGIGHYRYCIPYNNDTKHLAGKSGEAPEFYKY